MQNTGTHISREHGHTLGAINLIQTKPAPNHKPYFRDYNATTFKGSKVAITTSNQEPIIVYVREGTKPENETAGGRSLRGKLGEGKKEGER